MFSGDGGGGGDSGGGDGGGGDGGDGGGAEALLARQQTQLHAATVCVAVVEANNPLHLREIEREKIEPATR